MKAGGSLLGWLGLDGRNADAKKWGSYDPDDVESTSLIKKIGAKYRDMKLKTSAASSIINAENMMLPFKLPSVNTFDSGSSDASLLSSLVAPYSLKYFLIFLLTGVVFLAFALFTIPLVALMPQKFAFCFTFGSLSVITSLAFLAGPYKFLNIFLSSEKRLFSICYFFTLFLNLYFTLVSQSLILVLIGSVLQIIALLWLLSTTIPGGVGAMSYITSSLLTMLKATLRR